MEINQLKQAHIARENSEQNKKEENKDKEKIDLNKKVNETKDMLNNMESMILNKNLDFKKTDVLGNLNNLVSNDNNNSKENKSPELNILDGLDKLIVNKNMDSKKYEDNQMSKNEINDMLKFSKDDDSLDKSGKSTNNDPKSLTPFAAQRETFRLIDTVKQLDDTITNKIAYIN